MPRAAMMLGLRVDFMGSSFCIVGCARSVHVRPAVLFQLSISPSVLVVSNDQYYRNRSG